MKHLENKFKIGMCWKNYGDKWELDHIIPVSYVKHEEFKQLTRQKQEKVKKIICHYTNIQPLFNNENAKKRDEITEEAKRMLEAI
jgi:hypothetical protein